MSRRCGLRHLTTPHRNNSGHKTKRPRLRKGATVAWMAPKMESPDMPDFDLYGHEIRHVAHQRRPQKREPYHADQ